MPANTSEIAFNSSLADVLRGKHPLWDDLLGAEQTKVIIENPRLRPDILVRSSTSQPVAIETEYFPANTVESDAKSRLGLTLRDTGEVIEQAIALRVPVALQHGQAGLQNRISQATFEYCLISGNPEDPKRWPKLGWLIGGVDDLARCIEFASYAERLIDEYIDVFTRGVATAANGLSLDAKKFPDAPRKIAEVLNQAETEQTNRMAMTIIGNALIFHATVAGAHDIQPIEALRRQSDGKPSKSKVLQCWDRILREVNYWPIFHVASMLLEPIRTPTANKILESLADTTDELAGIGISTMHDLSGRMFQKLIADRKFLATFYTLPTSATLLAELAVGRLEFDWKSTDSYPMLRIADLSCGTGTLLSAAYHAVLSRYRRAGGNDAKIHKAMMEDSIIAADIMPAATHLAASQLSSAHPTVTFSNTKIYTMPYGVSEQGATSIGSLELLDVNTTRSIFATAEVQAHGEVGELGALAEVQQNSLDVSIMNPPFTRPTNHESTTVPIPSFAGFETSNDEQRAMSSRLKSIRKRLNAPAGHGNAGLASNFIDLADAKIKPSGVVAFVLPFAVAQGESWNNARDLLAKKYNDILIVTIATSGTEDRAFSADTGMAEALIIAKKRSLGDTAWIRTIFVSLSRRPANILEAAEMAGAINRIPEGADSGRLMIGTSRIGSYVRAPIWEGGCAALGQPTLAKVMMDLSNGKLCLPQTEANHNIPVTNLGTLGNRGLLDRDISDRGPFEIVQKSGVPDYPVLWSHDAQRERLLFVEPDTEGAVRSGHEEAARIAWRSATKLHFNRDFQINSQSLAACLTTRETLGGRAWPNFGLEKSKWEAPVLLWANTTLGLMSFWWAGTRQQQGRAILTISALPSLLSLDPRDLSDKQFAIAGKIVKTFRGRTFLPANEAYRDPVRQDLDEAVLLELLGLPEDILQALENVRLQWCAEPSVHGGKGTGPEQDSGDVIDP